MRLTTYILAIPSFLIFMSITPAPVSAEVTGVPNAQISTLTWDGSNVGFEQVRDRGRHWARHHRGHRGGTFYDYGYYPYGGWYSPYYDYSYYYRPYRGYRHWSNRRGYRHRW